MSYRDWVASNLNEPSWDNEINSFSSLGDSLIEIQTKERKTLIVGVIESLKITSGDVSKVYNMAAPKRPNVVIGKGKAIWDGSAINYARQRNMGWGGMGQLHSAFHTDDYAEIQKREYSFVESNLSNHHRVRLLERLYDRIFKIHRTGGLSPITIVLIDSYELTGEEVRNAIINYGKFDAVLKTNPNGSPTGNAYTAAAEIGADIFVWAELFGRLNRK